MKKSTKLWIFTAVIFVTATAFNVFKIDIQDNWIKVMEYLMITVSGTTAVTNLSKAILEKLKK